MKYKIINNKLIITKNNFTQTFVIQNLEQLLEDPILEHLTMEELIVLWNISYGVPSNIKKYLLKKCELHDKSTHVNGFIYKDQYYWFDKNTRASLLALASCSEDLIPLVLRDIIIEIDPDKLKEFLAKLEVYASKCYVNTQKHLKAIKELKSIEDIINYDYTTGYPEKIILNV